MYDSTTINVNRKTRDKLMRLKYQLGFNSMDELINALVDERNSVMELLNAIEEKVGEEE